MVRDIYNLDARLASAMKLCYAELPTRNYHAIQKYVEFCLAKNMRKNGLAKIVYTLKICALMAKDPLPDLDEKGIIRLLAEVHKRDMSEVTKMDYVKLLRGYYLFEFRGTKKKLEFAKDFLRRKRHVSDIREPAYLLQPRDVEQILYACRTHELKTLIMMLWETGARIGEILNLKFGEIQFDAIGAIIRLDGKTGIRYNRIIECVPLLQELCAGLSDYESYVFWFNYGGFKKWFKKIKLEAGFPEIYPHLFRKSRVTFLLESGMTEPMVKKYVGLSPKSRAIQNYDFRHYKDSNEAYLRLHQAAKGQLPISLPNMIPIPALQAAWSEIRQHPVPAEELYKNVLKDPSVSIPIRPD